MYLGRGLVGSSVAHRCVMARKYVSDLDSDVVGKECKVVVVQ